MEKSLLSKRWGSGGLKKKKSMLGLTTITKWRNVMKDFKSINVYEDILNLVAEILETDASGIKGDANFVKDLGMDSMMALEVLASIEKKYRVVIPEECLPKFVSLNETVRIVQEIFEKQK